MIIHVVKPNDSVYAIAKSYGVPPSRIINDNELKEPNKLVVGQTLVIMYPKTEHLVMNGDSLYSISEQYDVSINQLLRNNPSLPGDTELFEGQVIVVDYDTPKKGTLSVGGYAYPFINQQVLHKTLPFLTYISVFSYTFDEEGNLDNIDDEDIITIAREYGVAPLMTISTLTPDGVFSSNLAHQLFTVEGSQEKLISQILDTVKTKNYYGVDLDFEYIYAEDRDRYSAFVQRISDVLNDEGYIVQVALAPKVSADQMGVLYEGHDYNAVGDAADSVLLMTYEWGYSYGAPMAVAPITGVRSVLEYGVSEIPPSKIYMGIPNYGYDWTLPYERGTMATSLGNVEAVEQAIDVKAGIMYDDTSQAPYYNYYVENTEHVVWFEDARSIEAKLNLANELGIEGIEYWNLMRYFPQNWLVLNSQYDINKVNL